MDTHRNSSTHSGNPAAQRAGTATPRSDTASLRGDAAAKGGRTAAPRGDTAAKRADAATRTGTGETGGGQVRQPALPFEPLPFDDESDRPIDLALTARARRIVAPEVLPRLQVVGRDVRARGVAPAGGRAGEDGTVSPVDADPLDPRDTRPARARALRRAGLDASDIADQLDVDVLLVDAWVGDVSPRRSRGSRRRAARPVRSASASPVDSDWEAARAAASAEAQPRLATDAGFAVGVGLLAAVASVDRHAVTLRIRDERRGGSVLGWLCDVLGVSDARVRVVVRVGPGVSGDLARHRWAGALGLSNDAVALARWPAAPSDDAVEARIRIGVPSVTARVAGWLDALGSAVPGGDATHADEAL